MPEFTAGPSWSNIALLTIEVLEAGRQPLAIDVRARRHAGAHVGVVLRERHRRRADVAADVEVLVGAIAAEIGQHVAVAGGADAGRAADLDQLLDARVLDRAPRAPSTAGAGCRRGSCRSLSPPTSVFSSSCASVSGCSPVSAIVVGGGRGRRLGRAGQRRRPRRRANGSQFLSFLPSEHDAMAERRAATRRACPTAARARRPCRGRGSRMRHGFRPDTWSMTTPRSSSATTSM